MPDEGISLTIAGAIFTGWSGMSLESALDTFADGVSLSGAFDPVVDPLLGQIQPFTECLVHVDGELVLTGLIDRVDFNESTDAGTFTIQGRSKAGQLVDCDIDAGSYDFKDLRLSEIARKLLAPFGIDLVVGLDSAVETRTVFKEQMESKYNNSFLETKVKTVSKTEYFYNGSQLQSRIVQVPVLVPEIIVESTLGETKAKPGQKVYEYLNGLATRKKILLTSDERGRLVMRQPPGTGKVVASIVAGTSPYIGGASSFDGTARFSSYKVLGQESGKSSVVGKAVDLGVPLYRPTVDVSGTADTLSPGDAAAWNQAHALSKSMGVTVDLSGWRNAEGLLWRKGDLVSLIAPRLRIPTETTFLVAGRTLKLSESGRQTTLRLVPPGVYSGKAPGGFPWE